MSLSFNMFKANCKKCTRVDLYYDQLTNSCTSRNEWRHTGHNVHVPCTNTWLHFLWWNHQPTQSTWTCSTHICLYIQIYTLYYSFKAQNSVVSSTVKHVLRNHCHDVTVWKSHMLLAEGPPSWRNWTHRQRQVEYGLKRDHIFMANRVVLQDKFYCI